MAQCARGFETGFFGAAGGEEGVHTEITEETRRVAEKVGRIRMAGLPLGRPRCIVR